MNETVETLWAKLERNDTGRVVSWHSLVDHSADVAAVVEALLGIPTIAARFAQLAQGELCQITIARLSALAFLHDAGKANRGFQSRWEAGVRGAGHIKELAWLFRGTDNNSLFSAAWAALRGNLWESWFDAASWPLFNAVFAHHGRPWSFDTGANLFKYWTRDATHDPIAGLNVMGQHLLRWFPKAFENGPILPRAPAFHHAFAGLLMLADWLGSDTEFFPFSNGKAVDRMVFARDRAPVALGKVGLSVKALRQQPSCADEFAKVFSFPARDLQKLVRVPRGQCVVLEAETGSGKTEAALWRFLDLFDKGEVDGLYFALPTRVAATQAFSRVIRFADAAFGTKRPAVVLAVPGQSQADGVPGHRLPDFDFAWDDDPTDAVRQARWAAAHPKRFLAAQIAVGTIDQALLGAIRTRHAHMRSTLLMRQLLVVDEVHASDAYMAVLLSGLLQAHLQAGGHALLLSATLGAQLRSPLLGTSPPSLAEAEVIPYPALFWTTQGEPTCLRIESDQATGKAVEVSLAGLQNEPDRLAALALEAARGGAKVLVIRNTVGAARATQAALEALGEEALMFRVAGVAAPHHSRFSATDRILLDRAVESGFGKDRPQGGLVVVGTQTLEISLDLDADVLLTDLCPADVLLQRIGRLHRHRRPRPAGYDVPRVFVLTPSNRDLLSLSRRGRHGLGSVYEDLRIIEATWRLIEEHPVWEIPAMNRMIVERALHPEVLAEAEVMFLKRDPAWRKKLAEVEGGRLGEEAQARHALLDREQPFDQLKFDADERVATRLGAADRLVEFPPLPGPFGIPVTQLRIPHHMLASESADADLKVFDTRADAFSFMLGNKAYEYDRYGLTEKDQR